MKQIEKQNILIILSKKSKNSQVTFGYSTFLDCFCKLYNINTLQYDINMLGKNIVFVIFGCLWVFWSFLVT
jgi:hypothetical protein